MIFTNNKTCSRCGKIQDSYSYMMLIEKNVWVCKRCAHNIETHG